MNKQTIQELALASGFKLKEQPDGSMDLNPYVYDFAAALEAKATSELNAQVELLLTAINTRYPSEECKWVGDYLNNLKSVANRTPAQCLVEVKAQAVEALKFPTMFRKMWAGGEVQEWIKEEAKLIRQSAKAGGK